MNNPVLIFDARVYMPGELLDPGWILSDGGQITCIGQGKPPIGLYSARLIDAHGLNLLPGFIDLHIHGSNGYEVMDADPGSILGMASFLVRHGVTSFLPTTLTATHEKILAAIKAVEQARFAPLGARAAILGVHLEGPYLNPERCGAQDPGQIRRANQQEFADYVSSGMIRLIAVAPEFPENLWLIEACKKRKITVSAGHTSANLDQMRHAISLGLSQVTHIYNAMGPLNHRGVGTVGAALALDELNCEMICDNVHVHPAAQKIAVRCKGIEKVILISDALCCAGLPDGEYKMNQLTVLSQGGAAYLESGSLAGSIISIDKALKNLLENTCLSLEQGWRMASFNAAKAIHIENTKGSIAVGKDADLVLLDNELGVRMTIVEGKIAYEAST